MITAVAQRWRQGRGTYRPVGEPIRTSAYEVAALAADRDARTFVEMHHYERSYPAALFRAGLYRSGSLVGVAVLSQPASQAALDKALPFPSARRAELGRFVLLDDVPANGESFFLARVFELARKEGFEAVYADSDPAARRTRSGEVVFGGHIGGIYQATNARYVGAAARRTRRMLPDGAVFNGRLWSKLRQRERGYDAGVELLVRHGATPPVGEWRAWLRGAVDAVTVPFRHPGNHRYLWALDRRLRRRLPDGQRYPKFGGALP